jgi:hypothetical protein
MLRCTSTNRFVANRFRFSAAAATSNFAFSFSTNGKNTCLKSYQKLNNKISCASSSIVVPQHFAQRRFDSEIPSPEPQYTTEEQNESDPRVGIFFGLFLVTAGIVFININERRAARQEMLDEVVEPLVVSLTDPLSKTNKNDPRFDNVEDLDGLIFHAFGECTATEPWPRDPDLGVHAPQKLRLQRHVEMYQWKEHKNESKNKDGKKTVTYTYTKVWSNSKESTRDNRNPTFPTFTAIREAGAVHMTIPSRPKDSAKKEQPVKLLLSANFVDRLHDFHETPEVKSSDNFVTAENRGFKLLPDRKTLYSKNANPQDPEIGDVRITYQEVDPGEHTALGIYEKNTGIGPVKSKLKETLAKSHGELVIPEEAHKMAGKVAEIQEKVGYNEKDMGLDFKLTEKKEVVDKEGKKSIATMLVIPDALVTGIEAVMLSLTPIEFAFIQREHACKTTAFTHNRQNQTSNTNLWNWIGLGCCSLGGAAVGSAASALVPAIATYSAMGGFATGYGIGKATRKGAREQIEAQYAEMKQQVKRIDKGTFEM